jgi:hypothetical protein
LRNKELDHLKTISLDITIDENTTRKIVRQRGMKHSGIEFLENGKGYIKVMENDGAFNYNKLFDDNVLAKSLFA